MFFLFKFLDFQRFLYFQDDFLRSILENIDLKDTHSFLEFLSLSLIQTRNALIFLLTHHLQEIHLENIRKPLDFYRIDFLFILFPQCQFGLEFRDELDLLDDLLQLSLLEMECYVIKT